MEAGQKEMKKSSEGQGQLCRFTLHIYTHMNRIHGIYTEVKTEKRCECLNIHTHIAHTLCSSLSVNRESTTYRVRARERESFYIANSARVLLFFSQNGLTYIASIFTSCIYILAFYIFGLFSFVRIIASFSNRRKSIN